MTDNAEQAMRMRTLFSAVIFAALDDAIEENKNDRDKNKKTGSKNIAYWARSSNGQEILSCVGIDPSERVVSSFVDFVDRGKRTSIALSIAEGDRRNASADILSNL